MRTTHHTIHIDAPPSRVYAALLDPQLLTTKLAPEGTGTRLTAVHENLPPGVAPADDEAGWQDALEKLAALPRPAP